MCEKKSVKPDNVFFHGEKQEEGVSEWNALEIITQTKSGTERIGK